MWKRYISILIVLLIIPVVAKSQSEGTISLNSWYSSGRGDNHATTNSIWHGRRGDTRSPDYSYTRLEGYVFDPSSPQPNGTVPLHSWYSRGRGDNFTTTNSIWHGKHGEFRSPDYGYSRFEGYVFDPSLPQPKGTVPLHSWYSPGLGDNLITTIPKWWNIPEISEYRHSRLEGYIVASEAKFLNWQHIGSAKNVVAMAALNGRLFAATNDNKLLMRESLEKDIDWQYISDANDAVAMAGINGKLFVATNDNKLWMREPVRNVRINSSWEYVGRIPNVVAMTAINERLFAATNDNNLLTLKPLVERTQRPVLGGRSWRLIGHANNVVTMTATVDTAELIALTGEGNVWTRNPEPIELDWRRIDQANNAVAFAAIGEKLLVATKTNQLFSTICCGKGPVLYEASDFRGRSVSLNSSQGHLDRFEMNDRVSSIRVPSGWNLTLFEHKNYCGDYFYLEGPSEIRNLKRGPKPTTSAELIHMKDHKDGNWGNDITSITIKGGNLASRRPMYGSLVATWAGVIDNKEGSGGRHGPFGNIHVKVYDGKTSCPEPTSLDFPAGKELRHFVLPGPKDTGNKCEWDDGNEKLYDSYEVFPWRQLNDTVTVFLYESDPGGKVVGRAHDPLMCTTVSRSQTEASVLLVSKYPSAPDAIERAGPNAARWINKVWTGWGGVLPSMFIRVKTYEFGNTVPKLEY